VHTAIGLAARRALEACLSHRTVQRDEGWDGIARTERRRNGDFRIDGG
jgi:hypothetical protein